MIVLKVYKLNKISNNNVGRFKFEQKHEPNRRIIEKLLIYGLNVQIYKTVMRNHNKMVYTEVIFTNNI